MSKQHIRAWRKARRLTQKQLAERMDKEPGERLMSYVTVSNIERGDQSPTLEPLNAFALALAVSVTQLIEHDPGKNGEIVDLLRFNLLERADDHHGRAGIGERVRACSGSKLDPPITVPEGTTGIDITTASSSTT